MTEDLEHPETVAVNLIQGKANRVPRFKLGAHQGFVSKPDLNRIVTGHNLEIVLHLGAHKTASTYIQRLLETNRDRLLGAEIGLIGPSDVRSGATAQTGLWRSLRRPRRIGYADTILRLVAKAQQSGLRRLIVSEENLIGHLNGILMGNWCYERAGDRLERVLSSLPDSRLTVMLGVRGYASFLPTAYAQALRTSGFVPFDQELRQRLTSLDRGWPDLIGDIQRSCPPNARLIVWKHEDFPGLEQDIVGTMVGLKTAKRLASVKEKPMQGPTDRAIQRLHQLARDEGAPSLARIRQVFRINGRQKGLAPFQPWSAREKAMLDARYEQDMIRLSQTGTVELMRPAASAA
ncbi:MAG: hypothetical protein AAF674_03290 [Pseudomonadota bacterium]